MAVSPLDLNLPQKIVKCWVCKEIYTNPQQLPCLHSFCDRCIDSDDQGQVKCPRCGKLEGPSQKQKDHLIQSVIELLDGSKEVCQEHNIKYDTFCKSCRNVICNECRTQCCSNYVHIQTDNIKELIAKESTVISQIAKENQETAADIYEKAVHEQQTQYKAKSEISSKISIFFYNLKTKFLEHLAEQEKIFQEQINEFYSKNEDQLNRKIRLCRSATEKLDQNMDLLGAFEKAPVTMSQFRVMDLVKNEISKCKSKMPTLDSSTVQFCPEESEIQTLFGIKPCSLKFSDDERDSGLDAHRTQTEYKIEDFLSYIKPTANVSREPESSTISNTTDETVNTATTPHSTTDSDNAPNISDPDRYNVPNASVAERYNDPNALVAERYNDPNASVAERYNDPNASVADRYKDTNASVAERYNDPNSSVAERYNDPNASVADRYNDPNTSVADRYNDPNASVAERYNDPNASVAERYNDPNASVADRYNAPNTSDADGSEYYATSAEISTPDPLVTDEPNRFFEYGDYIKTFKSQLIGDLKSSTPCGMTWINEKQILMVDRFNHKLKLVTEYGAVVGTTVVQEGEPWDVVYVNRKGQDLHFCAVSVPTARMVLFVRVCDKIVIVRRIRTQFGAYCSLGHDKTGHALVCGICPPFGTPSVHIINSEGAVLREFVVDSLGHPLFEYPRSINVTSDGEVVICDWKKKRLLFLNSDGYIFGEYRGSTEHPMVEPIGTTLDGFGNVLVTDTATNTIQTISIKDRQFIACLKLDTDINCPREITITQPGHYPKLAVATFGNINIIDLRTSDSCGENLTLPSAPDISLV